MSEAAERYVRSCAHPTVKGGTRALFDAIAHFIPEGQTTTTPIGMEDLAVKARLNRRTVLRRVSDLVDLGEVRIVDGGQGRTARYQILHLDGAGPIVAAPLPLRADLQPVPRRTPRPSDTTTLDLFDPPVSASSSDQTAINLRQKITSGAAYLRHIVTSWVSYLRHRVTSRRSDSDQPATNDHRLPVELVIDAPVLTTARDVQQLKTTTTTAAAPRDGPQESEEEEEERTVPRRPVHPWHAWCDGRVHVPKDLHPELLAKLGRFPNETADAQEARLFAFYAQTCAALSPWESVGKEFTFWNRAFAKTFAPPVHRAPPKPVEPRDSSTCSHQPRCRTDRDCIARVIADSRAERERKSG